MHLNPSRTSVVSGPSFWTRLLPRLRSSNPHIRYDKRADRTTAWTALPLILTFASLGATSAHAASHYVRQGGTGTQQGFDWNNAYPSLPADLVRGDTYYIADGTYAGHAFETMERGTAVIVIKKATAADHGTSEGWKDEFGDGQATFSGQLRFATAYWLIDGVTGGGAKNRWAGSFGFKITEADSSIISIDGPDAHHVTIRHVDMVGKGRPTVGSDDSNNFGLAVYGAANVTLSYYRMTGIGNCPFFLSASNFIAEHGWVVSYFGDTTAHAEIASIYGFAGGLGDTTFRHNLFTDVQSTGGLMWDNSANTGARLNVYGNVFYKPRGASWDQANGLIGGWAGFHGEQFRNVTVSNNTFINVDQESLSTMPDVHSNNAAYNNLYVNSKTPNFDKFESHNYNYFINPDSSPSEPNPTGLLAKDPFLDLENLDFRLKAAMTGSPLQAPFDVDPMGHKRGADGISEPGAFEFAAGVPASSLPAPGRP